MNLLSELPDLNYCLLIDNYFTSVRLLSKLKERGISVTGTIRANRVEKCPLRAVDKMKREDRGSYDSRLDKTSGVQLVRWNDNSVVTVASNTFGIQPLTKVSR